MYDFTFRNLIRSDLNIWKITYCGSKIISSFTFVKWNIVLLRVVKSLFNTFKIQKLYFKNCFTRYLFCFDFRNSKNLELFSSQSNQTMIETLSEWYTQFHFILLHFISFHFIPFHDILSWWSQHRVDCLILRARNWIFTRNRIWWWCIHGILSRMIVWRGIFPTYRWVLFLILFVRLSFSHSPQVVTALIVLFRNEIFNGRLWNSWSNSRSSQTRIL
jgi:hypothetical protein